jgi:hypothetical protein
MRSLGLSESRSAQSQVLHLTLRDILTVDVSHFNLSRSFEQSEADGHSTNVNHGGLGGFPQF